MMDEPVLELYKKHRPKKFSDLVGQDDAVRMLTDMGKRKAIPHCLLLTGPSGCGKTTIARILKEKLRCSDSDFAELNIADVRGIDVVRSIRDRMGYAPMGGQTRIWLLDEIARATKDAQNAFLKMLEDTPEHVYFILATTEPQQLLGTIKTRATEVKVRGLKPKEMEGLLGSISEKEQFKLSEEVRDKIVQVADGSPRKALVLLNQIVGLDSEEEQLAVVVAGDSTTQAIDLARALINPKPQWSNVAKVLKGMEDDAESVRRVVLGYCSSIVLSGGNLASRAAFILDVFRDNFYDSGKSGLIGACWEVVKGK